MIGSTAESIHRCTADEYYAETEQLEQRTELLDGEIVDMASPSIRHQRISRRLIAKAEQFIRENGGKCEPFPEIDVKLDDLNIVVPDVMIACDPEKFDEQKYNGAPDFVAEIVSSNRSNDFDRKLWLYRRSGVREYWIIDPKHEKVLVYFFEETSCPEVYDFHTPIPVHIWENRLTVTIAELERV